MIPVSEGLQRPRHPQLESSSPPTLNQSDKTVTNARKISTEGKNPLHTNRHSHTPPLCLFPESGGCLPQKQLLALLRLIGNPVMSVLENFFE